MILPQRLSLLLSFLFTVDYKQVQCFDVLPVLAFIEKSSDVRVRVFDCGRFDPNPLLGLFPLLLGLVGQINRLDIENLCNFLSFKIVLHFSLPALHVLLEQLMIARLHTFQKWAAPMAAVEAAIIFLALIHIFGHQFVAFEFD